MIRRFRVTAIDHLGDAGEIEIDADDADKACAGVERSFVHVTATAAIEIAPVRIPKEIAPWPTP